MKKLINACFLTAILVILCASCSNRKEQEQTEIAINATTPDVGIAAVAAVSSEELLGRIAKEATTQEAADAAFKKIKKLASRQDWLLDAARNATHANIRLFAVERINDQPTLAYVAKNDTDDKVLALSVNKLIDDALLVDVAKNAKQWKSRAWAVNFKVTEPAVLDDLAMHDSSAVVRLVAVRKVTNQEALAFVATNNNNNDDIRNAAMDKLTDQAALAKIATNDRNDGIRILAISKLNDPQALAFVAKNDINHKARTLAVSRINDQETLVDVMFQGYPYEMRDIPETAFQKLADQSVLARIAKGDNTYYGPAAAKKLTDENILIDVAKNAKVGEARLAAVEKIDDQTLLAQFATDPYYRVGHAIVEKLTDQKQLTHVALYGNTDNWTGAPFDVVTAHAASKVTDQGFLVIIIKNSKNSRTRQEACHNLNDQAVLLDIMQHDPEWPMREIAAGKINDQTILSQKAADTSEYPDVRRAAEARLRQLNPPSEPKPWPDGRSPMMPSIGLPK